MVSGRFVQRSIFRKGGLETLTVICRPVGTQSALALRDEGENQDVPAVRLGDDGPDQYHLASCAYRGMDLGLEEVRSCSSLSEEHPISP